MSLAPGLWLGGTGVIATLNPQGTDVHESFDDEEKKVVFPAASEDVEKHVGIDMCKIPHQTRGTDFYIWRGAVLSAGYDPTASSEQTVLYIRAAEDLARENSVARPRLLQRPSIGGKK
jgi:hypothetical protein